MRKVIMATAGSLMLAGCGGGSGESSGSTPVTVVTAPTATTTPVATTPTTPTTTTPTVPTTTTPTTTTTTPAGSSYQRYADLAGDQTFQTACASLVLGSGLPNPQPAVSFGDALVLGRGAGGGFTVGGDNLGLSFAAGDAVSAPAGQRTFERSAGQRLTTTDPVAGGATLDYTRSFDLRTERTGGRVYSCVFGVPTLAVDIPTVAVGYGKVGVNGTAYVLDANGAVQTYVLSGSTGTVSYDATTRAVIVKVRLIGNLQTGSGVAATGIELGNYTGSGVVDAARGRFSGQVDSADRISLFSSFSGAFFGSTEAASAFEILAADPGTGNRVAVVGTVAASR